MRTLREIVEDLDELEDDETIYTDGSSPAARALVSADDVQTSHRGLRYFLEVALAREAVAVWSEWRNGTEPTIDEKLVAISYYAIHDAYLPRD